MTKQEGNHIQEPAKINATFTKNLATYAAAAGAAGVSLLAMTPSAEAKVIYTPAYLRLGTVYLDLNHDGVYDIGIRSGGGCVSEEKGSICFAANYINSTSTKLGRFLGAPGFTPALFAGQEINPAAQFSAREVIAVDFYRYFSGTAGPADWFGPFANGGKGVRDRYIAFKFNIGSEPHFGWLRLSVQIKNPNQDGYNAYITGYAWETEANKGLVTGQTTGAEIMPADVAPNVPPAANLGMLARGADALAIWRRDGESELQ
jgi:hypothetical protein